MAKSTIGFSVYLNGKLINEVKFDRPIINVGKLSTSTLRLDDINVSRKHAVIEQREDGKWRVTDLGSTNGTVLRGERVVQAEIKDGDRLVLGTTTLVVQIDEAAATRAAPVVATSGVAGDRAPANDGEATAIAAQAMGGGDGTPQMPAGASGPVKPEEIRGLGEDSFYKKKSATEGATWALDIALLWGETVLSSKTFMKSQDVVLADNESADFAIPREILGSETFKLVRASDSGFTLDLSNPNVTGDVLLGDKVKSVQELAEENKSLPIKGALRARLKVGEFTILLAHAPVVTAVSAKKDFEKEPFLFIGLSALVQIAFLIIASTAPDDLLMSTRDPRAQRQKVIQALKITPEQLEEEKKKEEAKKEDEIRKDKDRVADEDLKVDPRDVIPVADPTPQVERTNPLVDKMQRKQKEDLTKLTPEQRQDRAKQIAQQTAMSQAFRANNPLFDKLMTSPDLDSKPSPFKALGFNDPNGSSDFGDTGNINPFSGFDTSGNGFLPSDGGLPNGDPNGGPVIADGLRKDPNGRDLGPVDFDNKPPEPRIVESPARISGELDENTVRQYIRRYLSGIKWCYQDRLQSNRKLGGKVTLAFTILPNGSVHEPRAANSSLGDPALDACIATKMARWRFPQPKDGGVVEVAYPLILKTQ